VPPAAKRGPSLKRRPPLESPKKLHHRKLSLAGRVTINDVIPREAYESLLRVLRTFFFQKKVLSGFQGQRPWIRITCTVRPDG
jgi:hypothetical protein